VYSWQVCIGMATVLLKEKDDILVRGNIIEITPLGFQCELQLCEMERLRDEAGRYKSLELELTVRSYTGECTINGNGSVYSVRRASQTLSVVTVRFGELEQNAYRLISEHLTPNPVFDIDQARSARKSRLA